MSVRRRNRSATKLRRKLNRIIERDGTDCFYCGIVTSVEARKTLCTKNYDNAATTLDHIKTHEAGGEFVAENLVIACYGCNKKRGNKTAAKFLKIIKNNS